MDERGISSRWLMRSALLAALLCPFALACREEIVHEMPAVIARMNDAPCAQADDTVGPMDTYLVELYEVPDPPAFDQGLQLPPDCGRCLGGDPMACTLESTTCARGGPVTATLASLKTAAGGLRIMHVGSGTYCLRLLALDGGDLGNRPALPVPCSPDWSKYAYRRDTARMCALSPPRAAGTNQQINLEVRCPNDDVQNPNGTRLNVSFRDCVLAGIPLE